MNKCVTVIFNNVHISVINFIEHNHVGYIETNERVEMIRISTEICVQVGCEFTFVTVLLDNKQ